MTKLKDISFKSIRNTRIILQKDTKDNTKFIYIAVIKLIGKENIKEFPNWEILRESPKYALISNHLIFTEQSFLSIMIFNSSQSFEELEKYYKGGGEMDIKIIINPGKKRK